MSSTRSRGRAKEVERAARALGVKPKQVSIESGRSSARKTIRVENCDVATVEGKL